MIKIRPDQGVMEKLKHHERDLYTASPVWHELNFGYQRLSASRKKENIRKFLETVILPTIKILPYNTKAAEWHAQERARLTTKGQVPPFVDGQIAAIAFVNDLTLVTRNSGDFRFFNELSIENWWIQMI